MNFVKIWLYSITSATAKENNYICITITSHGLL